MEYLFFYFCICWFGHMQSIPFGRPKKPQTDDSIIAWPFSLYCLFLVESCVGFRVEMFQL